MSKKQSTNDNVKLRGIFRVQVVETGEDGPRVVGDSGWKKNVVTDQGIQDYIVRHLIGDTANRKFVQYANLGTGTAPASTALSLPGEFSQNGGNRLGVTANTSIVSSKTAQWTGQFLSNLYFTASTTIANIGLFSAQGSTAADLFAGNTYTGSTVQTNQNVNFTYQIRFQSTTT